MRFKGGILYYSLLVIILCSSVIGLILLSSYYENRRIINIIKQDELERNVFSAINVVLSKEYNDYDTLVDLFQNETSHVTIARRKWGGYDIVSAKAEWENLCFQKKALIGVDIESGEPISLYLADEGRILSLSGETILSGTCYLPSKTAHKASIEGQHFAFKEIVKGEIKGSKPHIPEINKEYFSFATKYLIDNNTEIDSVVNIKALDSNIVLNSFQNKTVFIYNECVKNLDTYNFIGNIIIWCTNQLIIDENTHIEDAIIFAPSIVIKEGFTGAIQAYALQSINVGNDCLLKYPSLLNIIQSEEKYRPSDTLQIIIGERTIIEGGITIKSSGLNSFLKIQKNSKIAGQIYCPGIVELYGDIYGTLFCKSFFLSTSKARYYNHLLNAKIDFNSLPEYFVGTNVVGGNKNKSVIKWLN